MADDRALHCARKHLAIVEAESAVLSLDAQAALRLLRCDLDYAARWFTPPSGGPVAATRETR